MDINSTNPLVVILAIAWVYLKVLTFVVMVATAGASIVATWLFLGHLVEELNIWADNRSGAQTETDHVDH